MPTRQKFRRDEMPPSRVRPCLSVLGEWERTWVQKLGLDDIPWDPEQCCEQCVAQRAARGEEVEEVVPPSRTRPKVLLSLGWAKIRPRVGDPRKHSRRQGRLKLLRLVRSARLEAKGS